MALLSNLKIVNGAIFRNFDDFFTKNWLKSVGYRPYDEARTFMPDAACTYRSDAARTYNSSCNYVVRFIMADIIS